MFYFSPTSDKAALFFTMMNQTHNATCALALIGSLGLVSWSRYVSIVQYSIVLCSGFREISYITLVLCTGFGEICFTVVLRLAICQSSCSYLCIIHTIRAPVRSRLGWWRLAEARHGSPDQSGVTDAGFLSATLFLLYHGRRREESKYVSWKLISWFSKLIHTKYNNTHRIWGPPTILSFLPAAL